MRRLRFLVVAAAVLASAWTVVSGQDRRRPNIVIFVADGLRHGSVDEHDTPALWHVRTDGVHFADSHSVFPTFTMANASAIATGHGLGDTGIFSNTIWPGFAIFATGNFDLTAGTSVPFLENDQVLADLDAHFGGNLLQSPTLLALARQHGYRTAAIGKLGPAALQDAASVSAVAGTFPATLPGIVIDDATGNGAGPPLPAALVAEMRAEGFPAAAPTRSNGFEPASPYNNGNSGALGRPGTLAANRVQQDWFVEVTTRFVLPQLSAGDEPFVLLFWSRDPDGTQHNHGDGPGAIIPGINGETSRRGVRNADRALGRLLAWLAAHPAIQANTDVIVTSDHGFATISRSLVDADGRATAAESARHDYLGPAGSIDTRRGTLPVGFLAIDLAHDLQLNLFDPDVHPAGRRNPRQVRIGTASAPLDTWEHPQYGNGLIGTAVADPAGSDAQLIVAANGGSDLVYVPHHDVATVRRAVDRLLTYDYVSGLFVDDRYGPIAGTLPTSAVNLAGSTPLPRPDIVVAFRFFYLRAGDLQSGVQVADTVLQQGQGMHGGFGRESTFNNMAAIGPDFKRGFADGLPVGNGDLAPTVARLLGFGIAGSRVGRVIEEALAGGRVPAEAAVTRRVLRSTARDGTQTVVALEEHGGVRYLNRGCFARTDVADADVCR